LCAAPVAIAFCLSTPSSSSLFQQSLAQCRVHAFSSSHAKAHIYSISLYVCIIMCVSTIYVSINAQSFTHTRYKIRTFAYIICKQTGILFLSLSLSLSCVCLCRGPGSASSGLNRRYAMAYTCDAMPYTCPGHLPSQVREKEKGERYAVQVCKDTN
jgi:hypothetical protein